MKIVVLDGHTLNPGDLSLEVLSSFGTVEIHPRTAPDQIIERTHDADIILTNKAPLTAETIALLKKTRLISVLATGFNIVDVGAAAKAGIVVCNVPAYSSLSVAQLTFALVLELCHHVGLHGHEVREGAWSGCPDFSFWKTPLVELAEKRMGIVGFGHIGRAVGAIAQAFGLEVWATRGRSSVELKSGRFAWKSISEIFSDCDIVTLHCPLTPENRGLVNRDLIHSMKKTAFLINTARGPMINENDLAAALNEGRLAGAALDVLSQEPPAAENPLLHASNCIITPHIAWATLEARRRLLETTIANIKAFLAGTPINVVSDS
jgi:glycerate dehydrogenase